ncbi:MAG: putative ABC exporter domain-containing protein, partial [Holdemania massiliensis]
MFYLYLIPDRPIKKLAALMVPSMLHMAAVVFASLVLCPLVLGAGWEEMISAAFMMIGFGWLFLSVSLVCLRLMKSRSTPFMEQMI